jgi:hypothetical protein
MATPDELPDGGAGRVADAVRGNWVDRIAPEWARPWLRLSRADRPVGTWLLLLPCWWGLALAALGDGWQAGDLWIAPGCALGAWLMRGAGCTWNDITDRDIDAQVARTRSRPLPSGDGQGGDRLDVRPDDPFGADPVQLHPRGDPSGAGLGAAGRRLPLCQALHLVAAGVSGAGL